MTTEARMKMNCNTYILANFIRSEKKDKNRPLALR